MKNCFLELKKKIKDIQYLLSQKGWLSSRTFLKGQKTRNCTFKGFLNPHVYMLGIVNGFPLMLLIVDEKYTFTQKYHIICKELTNPSTDTENFKILSQRPMK